MKIVPGRADGAPEKRAETFRCTGCGHRWRAAQDDAEGRGSKKFPRCPECGRRGALVSPENGPVRGIW